MWEEVSQTFNFQKIPSDFSLPLKYACNYVSHLWNFRGRKFPWKSIAFISNVELVKLFDQCLWIKALEFERKLYLKLFGPDSVITFCNLSSRWKMVVTHDVELLQVHGCWPESPTQPASTMKEIYKNTVMDFFFFLIKPRENHHSYFISYLLNSVLQAICISLSQSSLLSTS